MNEQATSMKIIARPVGMGLFFGIIGILLTLVGIVRGEVPTQPANIAVALALGGAVWFLIAWAVATAAHDVESDVAAQDDAAVRVVLETGTEEK
jgi:hypothetical protein